jgi:hypothetical protein
MLCACLCRFIDCFLLPPLFFLRCCCTAADPGDVLPVVLSGALQLPPLAWTNYSQGPVPGVLVAPVSILPDARASRWAAEHSSGGTGGRAGPPPLVASLFINGTRTVRARWPNGNPADGSGLCISRHQMRPGEGCDSWSDCAVNSTGFQAAPAGIAVTGGAPDRGSSTTQGCSQCSDCGIFGYTIYPPPPDHPVYNAPLPGVGWDNTSVFVPSQPSQFDSQGDPWPSLFQRSAGFNISTAGKCSHWARAATYAQPTGAVIAMIHDKQWGGWHFVLDNVSSAEDASSSVFFNVGYGGYQEARGPQTTNGVNSFYVRARG